MLVSVTVVTILSVITLIKKRGVSDSYRALFLFTKSKIWHFII